MANNGSLHKAKEAKFDEFYTQYADIQREMNAYIEYNPNVFRDKTILLPCDDPEFSNFTRYFATYFETYGIKKLISTSYAQSSKSFKPPYQISIFDSAENNPKYDADKADTHGKIFILERGKDADSSGWVDIDDIQCDYLKGDGDFRSDEIRELLSEVDFIITNPPFSLWREFFAWCLDSGIKFSIIGNTNAITYKEVFPHIRDNRVWIGASSQGQDMVFAVPDKYEINPKDKAKAEKLGYKGQYTRLGNALWFTNIDHGGRHRPLALMSGKDNMRYNKIKQVRERGYPKYDNYNAIEVNYWSAIPSDYKGVMGVSTTGLNRHCPEQFEIVGCTESEGKGFSKGLWTGGAAQALINGERVYKRLFIRYTDGWIASHSEDFKGKESLR